MNDFKKLEKPIRKEHIIILPIIAAVDDTWDDVYGKLKGCLTCITLANFPLYILTLPEGKALLAYGDRLAFPTTQGGAQSQPSRAARRFQGDIQQKALAAALFSHFHIDDEDNPLHVMIFQKDQIEDALSDVDDGNSTGLEDSTDMDSTGRSSSPMPRRFMESMQHLSDWLHLDSTDMSERSAAQTLEHKELGRCFADRK